MSPCVSVSAFDRYSSSENTASNLNFRRQFEDGCDNLCAVPNVIEIGPGDRSQTTVFLRHEIMNLNLHSAK